MIVTDNSLNTRLEALSQLITGGMGLYYPPVRIADLERGVRAITQSRVFESVESCIDWLLTPPVSDRIDALAKHLTIGETYFFRHPETFHALERVVLPPLLAARGAQDRRLRIWCAACSTGEEPYSVAIMLRRLLPDIARWNITIVATDINRDVIVRAIDARYGEWSFRGASDAYKQTAFEVTGPGRYRLLPELRQMVRFEYLNLADLPLSGTVLDSGQFDLVFCRNVMIYFTEDHIRRLFGEFSRLIAPGGWLLTSPVETIYSRDTAFTPVTIENAMLLRNDIGASLLGTSLPVVPRIPHLTERFAVGTPAPQPSQANSKPERFAYPESAPGISAAAPSRSLPPTQTAAVPANGRDIAGRLYAQGQLVAALNALQSVPDMNDEGAFALRARILADLGNLGEAQIWCEKAMASDRIRPELQYLLATIHLAGNRPEPAADALRRAIFLDSEFVMAHYTLALLARSAGRIAEADKQLRLVLRLLEKQPDDTIVPESEGMSAGRMRTMTESILQSKV